MPPRSEKKFRAAVQAHVPMKPVWFEILLSIATGEAHGYAIRRSVQQRTGGKTRLWPTTLYGTLRQIEDAGLVRPRAEPGPEDPRGKRCFELTDAGVAVLEAEIRRLEGLVALARGESVLAQ